MTNLDSILKSRDITLPTEILLCRQRSIMAESEEELKTLLMKVKEESEKFGLVIQGRDGPRFQRQLQFLKHLYI